MADLSIIIPTKDRLWALPTAIESCRQDGISVNIIVIDDGSTDGTSAYLANQPDVKVVQLEGWGKPFAINQAMKLIDTKFVRFLDSDDYFPEGTLLSQVNLLQANNADVVVAGYIERFDETEVETVIQWEDCGDFISQQLGECNSSHYSAFTFRTQCIKDIPHRSNFPASRFATRDDRCFMLEVALLEPSVVIDPKPGLVHRHHGKARLQKSSGLFEDAANLNLLLIYRKILQLLEEKKMLSTRRRKAAIKVLWPLSQWISKRYPKDGASIFEWILELDPEFQIPPDGLRSKLYAILGFRRTEDLLRLRRKLLR